MLCPARIDEDGLGRRLVFVGGAMPGTPQAELSQVALDRQRHTWHVGGQRGSLTREVTRVGADLELSLTAVAAIVRWPGGEDVGWQMQALLCRLRSIACINAGS